MKVVHLPQHLCVLGHRVYPARCTLVFAYLVYSCYHSGKSRQRGNGVPWKRVPGMCGDGRAARMSDKVLGEKPKLWGIRTGRAILDPKGLDSVITGSSPKVR